LLSNLFRYHAVEIFVEKSKVAPRLPTAQTSEPAGVRLGHGSGTPLHATRTQNNSFRNSTIHHWLGASPRSPNDHKWKDLSMS
jgi:hypothetical protein